MRHSLPLIALLLVAGCGQAERDRQGQEDLKTYDAVESADMSAPSPASPSVVNASAGAGPDVGPTAAPGVAFNYRYAFRLAAPRIAEVQEQHAQLCERLTVARCRITGMLYRVVNDRDIEAALAFKLDPSIARHFGRGAVEAVVRAEGMLTESEITGTDVGGAIQAAGRNIAELNDELRRIEAQLARRGLSSDERARLEYDARQLRESIRANRTGREQNQESLATTPMVFRYGSGELVPGFDTRPSYGRALERARDNFLDGVAILFVILVTALPWALVLLAIWWVARVGRRRWGGDASKGPDAG